MLILKVSQTDFHWCYTTVLDSYKVSSNRFNSFLQWYNGEKGLIVKTGQKLFRIFSTYFLREFKKVLEKYSPFRPILLAIKTLFNNLAKFLVLHIEPITKNNLTVNINFGFSKEIFGQNPERLSPLTLSSFSPTYHWSKLLKSVVTHFIRIKNCCVASVKSVWVGFKSGT